MKSSKSPENTNFRKYRLAGAARWVRGTRRPPRASAAMTHSLRREHSHRFGVHVTARRSCPALMWTKGGTRLPYCDDRRTIGVVC